MGWKKEFHAACDICCDGEAASVRAGGEEYPSISKAKQFCALFTQASLPVGCRLINLLCNQLQRGAGVEIHLKAIQSCNVMNQEEVMIYQPLYANP